MNTMDLIQLVIQHWITWVVCIITLGLIAWERFRRRANRVIEVYNTAIVELDQTISQNAVFERFENLRQLFSGLALIGKPWNRYSDHTLPSSEDQMIYSTHDPESYFSFQDTLRAGKINSGLLAAVPAILTGLGILGTFVGLTFGIGDLAEKMEKRPAAIESIDSPIAVGDTLAMSETIDGTDTPTDVDVMLDGVRDLLRGAKLAFLTSIFGMICSMLFTYCEKKKTRAILEQYMRLMELMRDAFPLRTAEYFQQSSLEQLEKQGAELARFNTDLAVTIAKAVGNEFSESIVKPMTGSMREVVTAITDMKEDRSASNDQMISQLMDKFTEKVTAGAGTEMNAMRDTFGQVEASLQSVILGLSSVESNLRTTLETATQKLDRGLEDTANNFGTQVGSSILAVTEMMLEQSRAIAGAFEQATGEFRSSLTTTTGEMNQQIRTVVEGAAGSFAAHTTAMGEALHSGAEHFNKTLGSSVDRFASASSGIQGALGALSGLMLKVQQAQQAQEELVKRFQQSHQSFMAVVSPLELAARQIESGGKQTAEASVRISTAGLAVQTVSERLESHNKTLETAWTQYSDRFAKVDEDLARATDALAKDFRAFEEKAREFIDKVDSNFALAISRLSEPISELLDIAQALEKEGGRRK
jgi:hypothetical protein